MSSVNLGTVHVSLEMRLQKMRDGIRDAKYELKGLESSMKSVGDTATRVGRNMSLAITAPLVLLGRDVIKTAANLDSLNMGIRAVDGEATDLAKTLKRLDELAKLPGLGLVQVREGYINLRAAGINGDFATRSLKAFGNALATVGKGAAELDGVNYALVQLANRTSGFGQEIRQLQNFLPQIREAMKAAFGTTDSEVISKSGITGMQFLEALVPVFERLRPVTIGAKEQLVNFNDQLIKLKESIGKALLPSLIKWMDELGPKIKAATEWFNKLDPAAKSTFANMALALAATGPLLVGLGVLLTSLRSIKTTLDAIVASPAFKALFSGPGAAVAGTVGLGHLLSAGPGAGQRQNERAAIIGQTWGLAPGFVPPASVKLPGGLHHFMPRGLPGKPPAAPPFKGMNLGGGKDSEEAKRIAELNLGLRRDLADEVGKIVMDAASERAAGGKPELVDAKKRMRIREVLKELDEAVAKEVEARSKTSGGLLTQVFLGGDSHKLTPQVQSNVDKIMSVIHGRMKEKRPSRDDALRNLFGDSLVMGMAGEKLNLKQIEIELPGENELRGPAEDFVARFMRATQEMIKKAAIPTDFTSLITGVKSREVGGSILDASDIGKQLTKAAKDAKKEARTFTFDLGGELGNNLASEMGRAFGDQFDKIFGTKSPLARALSRTFSRLVDDLLFGLMQKAIGSNLLINLFGGAGGGALAGAAGAAGGAALAGGGAAAGAAAGGGLTVTAAGAGSLAGGAFALAFAAAAAWGISRLLQGKGRYSLETAAAKMFPGTGKLGISSMYGGTGVGVGNPMFNVQFYNSQFRNNQDPVRTAESLAWHTQQKMRSRAGG